MRSAVVDDAVRQIVATGTTMRAAAERAGFNQTYVRVLKSRKNRTLVNLERLLAANGLELRVVRREGGQ